jgi:CRISPR-associated protein Cas2
VFILVCYDVSTETKQGRRRLRRVAKACEAVGQRVQQSVFECRVDRMKYEEFERTLLEEIDQTEDCLRIYRLTEPSVQLVKEYGKFRAIDFDAPLVL